MSNKAGQLLAVDQRRRLERALKPRQLACARRNTWSALVERRAALTERLAVELDEDAFRVPHLDEFDPEADRPPDPTPTYLSPMEALLLDIALGPTDPDRRG